MEQPTQLQQQMLECLSSVVDPELGVDIVNLGLIYKLAFVSGTVTVQLTLTTMGCPLIEELEQMIRQALLHLKSVKTVQIELVWEPAWTPQRMSRAARLALGIH
ncbi:metal-sulfur cluster assembly factor [Fructilactobacillus hinvesii]|uniref:Metal-sulfur cluster assembly factor n=1 Tax=Fructilactobacillus hinvesii TaxID=2940300 RepID=A0ABY5BTR6_9LACO|nr:metal-sulfur cluster assembly factor [Fructilactobacillus hinvesii]USS88522.1 metal-sulfur cluster assembly factor [Fructilactobacillus hinvesii]